MERLLIIFVRNPELGKVKTRLAKQIGDEAALAIYLKLVTYTQGVTNSVNCAKAVYYSEYVDTEDSWDNNEYKKFKQKGANLGERMANAIKASFEDGYKSVCLIGTDSYELTPAVVEDAFALLVSDDVVIGPARDGGYYLIGMKAAHPEIFDLAQWSTPDVFNETVKILERENLSYSCTKVLNDIDVPEDLKGTDLE